MNAILQKLSSRKLWAAVVGVFTGLAMVFGLDESTISTVSGAVVSVGSIIAYIVTEGKIDAAAVKTAAEKVQAAVTAVEAEDGESK
jgi:phage shock protein PspC (stress-responsive transcriptional regulator)